MINQYSVLIRITSTTLETFPFNPRFTPATKKKVHFIHLVVKDNASNRTYEHKSRLRRNTNNMVMLSKKIEELDKYKNINELLTAEGDHWQIKATHEAPVAIH
ncbi:hypothetical protein [Photobacterium kishitanii]|uniref:Uncharacterized protein n=1 Tax=Photobacterium kishitanii TaxID=318456 RepID=A0A2T3KLJ6_9GAMM|nr:hypothetical protein [Photobacterium kishitanii]PSV00561.1 hypothetical protein C9J27_05345 [Photobacterium kishitanii]